MPDDCGDDEEEESMGEGRLRDRLRLDPTSNLAAGAFGGLCSLLVGHPLDTIKVRMQTRPPGGTTSVARTALELMSEGGVRSVTALYRGASATAALALPRFALVFHANAWGRSSYRDAFPDREIGDLGEVLFGGLCSQLLVVPLLVAPLERIKVLMQSDPRRHRGQLSCLRFVLARSGVRLGLYKGVLATYARDLPSFAVYFSAYEWLRRLTGAAELEGCGQERDYTGWIWRTLLSGGLAGVAGWAVAIPMDTVKNRHQASMEGGGRSGVVASWSSIIIHHCRNYNQFNQNIFLTPLQ